MDNSKNEFSKTSLSKSSIQSELSNCFGIGPVSTVTEIDSGINTAAIIQTEFDNKYFVKFNTFRPSSDLFHAQPFVLSYLSEGDYTFQTPTPIGYDYTNESIQYDWYMTEFVNGDIFDSESNKIPEQKARIVGSILGEINSISVNGVGYVNAQSTTDKSGSIPSKISFSQGSWQSHLKEEMRHLVSTADYRFDDLRESLDEFIDDFSVRTISPQLTHFDYWWENIMWVAGVTEPYVIDWERAVGGDPLANRVLSEHYMFDTVAIESECFTAQEYQSDRTKLRDFFRNAYESSYSGKQSLKTDSETELVYKLLLYVRELRGFPYWWRDKSNDWKQNREKALRTEIEKLLH